MSDLSIATLAARVEDIERHMLAMPQVALRVVHHFSHGLYARELHIPAGTCLTGAIHKYANFNVLSAGEMTVLTETGARRVRAPFSVVSPPGTKRIAYAHTDCVWTTVHATDSTDVDEIEAAMTARSVQGYLDFIGEDL